MNSGARAAMRCSSSVAGHSGIEFTRRSRHKDKAVTVLSKVIDAIVCWQGPEGRGWRLEAGNVTAEYACVRSQHGGYSMYSLELVRELVSGRLLRFAARKSSLCHIMPLATRISGVPRQPIRPHASVIRQNGYAPEAKCGSRRLEYRPCCGGSSQALPPGTTSRTNGGGPDAWLQPAP